MKLEPIAKPIRIRIKLGDSEYSSLDSVKSNFSIKELFPLFKDGRLERWLMQIGEVQLARDTSNMSKQCGNGGIEDYIKFLSLFFNEVAVSLAQYKINKEWSLRDYLSNVSLDTIRIVYSKTKGIEGIDWPSYIDRILSKENALTLFEDAQLHSVYDDGEWGKKLSDIVKTENDYKTIFKFLGTEIKKQPEYQKILQDFYKAAADNGYVWASVFGSEDLGFLLEWYSNSFFTKKCKQDWKSIIRPHLSVENVKEIFESEYSDIFYGYWGEEFANLVTDKRTYKILFTYLENYSRNSRQPDRCRNIISTFYSVLSKKGYQWASIFKDELTIEFLSNLYKNECIQILNFDWGKLFADCVTNWGKDSVLIESVLKGNGRDVVSFYNNCAENGFEEAKLKIDPWPLLANSDDYIIVDTALQNFREFEFRQITKRNLGYDKVTSSLGMQILDLLLFLGELYGDEHAKRPDLSDNYLNCLKDIMIYVRKHQYNQNSFIYHSFPKEYKRILETMKDKHINLASTILNNKTLSYNQICNILSVELQSKLKNERRNQ